MLTNAAKYYRLILGALLVSALYVSSPSRSSDTRFVSSDSLQSPARVLSFNESFQQNINGAEIHTYQIALAKDQFARIVLDQRGVDLVLSISGGDAAPLKVDNPNGSYGIESASILASQNSAFSITVKTTGPNQKGIYQLKVEGPRDRLPGDEDRVRAEHTFANAQLARRAGRSQEALDKYNEALTLAAQLGDQQLEAYSAWGLGRVYRTMGKLDDSLQALKRALNIVQTLGDVSGQAFDLNEIGATYRDLGDPLPAITYYQQALELREKLNDGPGRAQLLNNIGLIYANTGEQKKAIHHYQLAQALWEQAEDLTNSARAVNNIAESYSDLGALSDAFAGFQRAITLCRKSGDLGLEASIENNLGKIYDTWADSQNALDAYQRALSIFTQLKDQRGEALVDENIGMVYAAIGDTGTALKYFQLALTIRENLKERRGLAISLDHLGFVQGLMGSHQEAVKNLKRSISLSQETRNRAFEAYSLTNLGTSYFALGDQEAARQNYENALAIQKELGDIRGQAITLDKLANSFASTLRTSDALLKYNEALKLWQTIGDRQGEILTLHGLARVNRNQGNLEEARHQIEAAIAIVESLRIEMVSPELRLTYFAAKEDLFELDIDLRMQAGLKRGSNADIAGAFYTSERSRARNLLDLLNLAHTGRDRPAAPDETARKEQMAREISDLKQTLWRLRLTKRSEDVGFIEERLTKLVAQYDEMRTRSAATDQWGRPQTAAQIQALLDDDTLLLEYSLGTEHSYLWAVTRKEVSGYQLDSSQVIEAAVEKFRRAITAYEPRRPAEKSEDYVARQRAAAANYREYGRSLSREVLGQVKNQLGTKRLVIVADGALQYLPFGALPNPGSGSPAGGDYGPLIVTNQIVNEPSASTVTLLRTRPRPAARKVVAVFADPVFNPEDPRVHEPRRSATDPLSERSRTDLRTALRDLGEADSSGDFRLERLAYSSNEASAIAAFAPAGSSKLMLSFAANRNAVLGSDLKDFRIVHFATHGVLNARHPELSGIVLSMVDERGQPQDGFLMLSDIYDLEIPVDLVVLSACQTGIGKQVRGEGLVALPRGFLLAGARKVVASLWRVDDEATTELMKRFYRNLLLKNMTVPEALRQAQVDLLRNTDQWRTPYYWAGFVLQGEWR